MLEQIEHSISNLFSFIDAEVLSRGLRMDQVVVLGVPLKCPHGQNAHYDRDTSFAALQYSLALKDRCRAAGYRFASPSDDLFDFAAGAVDPYFWTTPRDFHCSPTRAFFFWHRAIQRATGLDWCRPSVNDGMFHFAPSL
jgi:hypothetical protein